MKKQIITILGVLMFIGGMFGFTKLSDAQTDSQPATPITPTVSGHSTGGVTAEGGGSTFKVEFNAHAGPKGKVNYSDGTKKFHGTVNNCYSQTGNTAVFSGTVDKGSVTEDFFVIEIQDNGQGKKATNPDMIGVTFSDTAPTCAYDAALLTAEVQRGNLVVHQ